MNLGPWAISDLWRGVGVNPVKAFQAHVDACVVKLFAWEAEQVGRIRIPAGSPDAAYQDEMRRG